MMSRSNRISTNAFLVFVLVLGTILPIRVLYSAEAGKKGGKVVLYTMMNAKDNDVLSRAFEKKHSGIVVEGYRGGPEALVNKVMTEARAGAVRADVIFGGASELQIFKKEGLLAPYVSSETKGIRDDFRDPDGYWTTVHLLEMTTAYNTDQIRPADVPKSYEDLLKPAFKGKMMMEGFDYAWFATMQKLWGREKTVSFCERLAAQNVRFVRGHTNIANLVAAGEGSIGINLFAYRVSSLKKGGAPIDWVAFDPVVTMLESVSLARRAVNVDPAKLLIDFMLSVEGQHVIKSFGRTPVKAGVEIPDEQLAKIKPYPIDIATIYREGLEPFGKEFRRIFDIK
jgi:iron(III) transport system substrate-binding protein